MKFMNNIDGKSDRPSEGFEKATFFLNNVEYEISQKNIKDLVLSFLKENTNKLWSTSEIYDRGFMVNFDADGNNRREWIAAISSSLNNLQNNEKVRSFPNKGSRGNIYAINDPSLTKHQDALHDFEEFMEEDASEQEEINGFF